MRYAVLVVVMMVGCVKAHQIQTTTRNIDKPVRVETQKTGTRYTVASIETHDDSAIVRVGIMQEGICQDVHIVDRTKVTERTFDAKATTSQWLTGAMALLSVGALVVGSASAANGNAITYEEGGTEPTMFTNGVEGETKLTTTGGLITLGGLGAAITLPILIVDGLKASDSSKRVGMVRKPGMPRKCGSRAASGQLVMEHIGNSRLSADGHAVFDLRNRGAEVLEHGPQLNLSIGSHEIGHTGVGLRAYYDALAHTQEQKRVEAERAAQQRRWASQERDRLAQEQVVEADRAEAEREAAHKRRLQTKLADAVADRIAKRKQTKVRKKAADEATRKRKREEALKALREASE